MRVFLRRACRDFLLRIRGRFFVVTAGVFGYAILKREWCMGFFLSKMLEKVGELQAGGIIDEKNAAAIRRELESELERSAKLKRRIFAFFLAVSGVVIAGLGVYVFLSAVWDGLGLAGRTLAAFAPLALSGVFGAFVILRRRAAVWRESAAAANVFGFCCAILVSAHIYQIDGSFADFAFVSLCLGMGTAFAFDSASALLFCAIMASSFGGRSDFMFAGFDAPLFLIFWAAIFCACVRALAAARECRPLYILTALILAIRFFPGLADVLGVWGNFYWNIPLGGLCLGAFCAAAARPGRLGAPFKIVAAGWACVFIAALSAPTPKALIRMSATDFAPSAINAACYFICAAAFAAAWIFFWRRNSGEPGAKPWFASSLAAVYGVCFALFARNFPHAADYATLAAASALAFYAIWVGIRKLSLESLNMGLAYLFTAALSEFFSRALGSFFLSAALVVLGAFVAGMNLFVARRRAE